MSRPGGAALKFVLLNSPSPDLSLESPERDTLLVGFGVILHGWVAKIETEVLGQGELRSDSSIRGESSTRVASWRGRWTFEPRH